MEKLWEQGKHPNRIASLIGCPLVQISFSYLIFGKLMFLLVNSKKKNAGERSFYIRKYAISFSSLGQLHKGVSSMAHFEWKYCRNLSGENSQLQLEPKIIALL